MSIEASTIASIQQEIEQKRVGVLLSVKLLNKDELAILIDDASSIIDKFHVMVDGACKKMKDYKIIYTPDFSQIYLIIPDDTSIAEKLAFSIYSQVQLYVDADFPESYLKCSIGSIRFDHKNGLHARKIAAKLAYGMKSLQDRSYYCYDDNPIDIEALREHNSRLNLLRVALLEKKVRFVYQPIVDRKSGNIEYYECLLRFFDENNKLISVGSMVEEAERIGLINVVDIVVIEMVINELVKDKNIKLSVNISNIGVLNKRLLRRIEHLLKKHDVADRLIIEITETSLNNDFITSKKFIDKLRSYGCKFALDDFGAGFSSFKQLLNLPVDIIKIDGSYIRNILSNNHSRFFVESLIKLASDLGIKTVAEFVENGEIARFLIDIKIGGMQGNFFLPASETRIN